jgi:hypothetical protein
MPRPQTPIELLQLNGGFRADRHGRRQAAPKSTGPDRRSAPEPGAR